MCAGQLSLRSVSCCSGKCFRGVTRQWVGGGRSVRFNEPSPNDFGVLVNIHIITSTRTVFENDLTQFLINYHYSLTVPSLLKWESEKR